MAFRSQCSWRAFFFGGEDPNRFASPQVRWPFLPMSFLAYRWVFATYQLTVFILDLEYWCLLCNGGTLLTYATEWTFILMTLYTTWSALATTYWHLKGKEMDDVSLSKSDVGASRALSPAAEAATTDASQVVHAVPWYFKANWLIQVLTCASAVAVTLIYWVSIYGPGSRVTFFDLSEHGIGLILLMVDFILVANPCRLLHVVYAVLYAAVYFLFTYVYYAAGGRNPGRGTAIYVGALDWGELPEDTLVFGLIATLVVAPLSHGMFFLLHLLKVAFSRCCSCCRLSTQ